MPQPWRTAEQIHRHPGHDQHCKAIEVFIKALPTPIFPQIPSTGGDYHQRGADRTGQEQKAEQPPPTICQCKHTSLRKKYKPRLNWGLRFPGGIGRMQVGP